MTNRLAENIRVFRKERGLTQEQLAEVLGVTVGAVYKWEAKLSLPELSLIMELADFFDTSVDVLLGYEMKDNRLRVTVERLKDYAYRKDRAGLAEAEKALKKYPNAFDVVYHAGKGWICCSAWKIGIARFCAGDLSGTRRRGGCFRRMPTRASARARFAVKWQRCECCWAKRRRRWRF